MTIKNRIRKLERCAEQREPRIGGCTQAEWEQIRAERIRLAKDPEHLDRLREQALREDCGEEAATWYRNLCTSRQSGVK